MAIQTYKDMLSNQGIRLIDSPIKTKDGARFCEVLDHHGNWKSISAWYDETGQQYPEETWGLAINLFERKCHPEWKSIRMVEMIRSEKHLVKIKCKGEENG
jgi:hypothetical protein